jgi:predicted ATPase
VRASCTLTHVSARIKRIEIEGFRVIDKLSLVLQPLNVLIGENGSGKSTVLEAFELIRKAATMNGEQFIAELHNVHGGFRMFRGGGGPGLTRRLSVGVEISSGGDTDYRYALELGADAEGGIRVTGEHLDLVPARGGAPSLKVIERSGSRARVYNQQAGQLQPIPTVGDLILLNALNAPGDVLNASLPVVRELLAATRVYAAFEMNPAWARRPGEPPSALRTGVTIRPATTLERGGANLPNAYQALRNRGNGTWTRIRETLALGLGDDVADISVDPDPGGGQVGLSLVFHSVGKVPAFALSDGQLAFLAFVAITELEADRDGVVGLDEPDLHQHPALVGYTVALVEKLSQRRTVVMTTHSDRVRDALSAPAADRVVLFKRDDQGRTRALRPNREQLARWLEEYAGLGSLRADGYGSTVFTEEASVGPRAEDAS